MSIEGIIIALIWMAGGLAAMVLARGQAAAWLYVGGFVLIVLGFARPPLF